MKRQDSVLSSSSRRHDLNTTPEILHAKTIGCMSGLFQLLSKYHRRRKFLTFGKEHERNVISSQSAQEDDRRKSLAFGKIQEKKVISPPSLQSDDRRLLCDELRSPTLQAKTRLSTTTTSSEDFRAPPALVARLMGLDDRNTNPSTPTQSRAIESAAEKRLQLFEALDKCHEDLRALKKIIDNANTGKPQRTVDAGEEQPSPVYVLDEFGSSPVYGGCGFTKRHANGQVLWRQQKKIQCEEDATTALNFIDRLVIAEKYETKCCDSYPTTPLTSNKAMKSSVEEVCKEVNWGEKREMGRIGLVLQDYICKGLIEEIVVELGCFFISSLPFDACRRRLCF